MCLDTHQILLNVGVFTLHLNKKKYPNGKLEVIFEAFPIAFIIEAAQGKAIDGEKRILDIKSPKIHQRTPMYFGSKKRSSKSA